MKGVVITFGQVVGKNGSTLEGFLAAVGGWLSGLMGGELALSYSLASLAILVGLDWVTGIRASRYEGKAIESSKLRRTSDKLIGYAVAVVVFVLMSREIDALKSIRTELLTGLLWWFMAVESWSVIENLDRIGIRIPKWIKKRLQAVKDGLDNGLDPKPEEAKGWKPLG